MNDVVSFVSANWVQWVFAALIAVLTWLYKGMSKRLAAETKKNEAIAAGVQSLLRESIVENYNKYSEKGYCPIYAKESMKKLYQSYHDLGGNDVATELYKAMLEMPAEAEDE